MFTAFEVSQKIQDQLVSWRRALHQIPEVGLDLPKTSAFVAEKLSEMKIECRMNIGGSGIVGLIKGKKGGKTIALRADMDALAIVEDTGLPFASTNGSMHACGHDAHTAMLLGAAKILNENKNYLDGNIKLIFQAGEEGPGGAKPMLEEGVFENPKVDAILGQHIGTIFTEVDTGQVGVSYSNLMASLDKFEMTIIGKGCHGAMPDQGVDPVVISAGIIHALQTIVSREIKPTDPAVISIGQIHAGSAYNIIPDSVEIVGTVRATSQPVRENISRRMEEMVSFITKSMRGDDQFTYTFGYPPLMNDAEFTKAFVKTAEKIVGKQNIVEITKPSMVGEDMAYYLEKVPGTFFILGGGNKEKGIVAPHHSSKFDIDEDVLWKGTALLAQGAIDWLTKPTH